MPRIARLVASGLPHHITQKGNYGQQIFIDDQDRQKYLSWLQEYSLKYSLSIIAYCLMQNHVHFIAIPEKDDSLAKTFNVAHMRYSQYFNKKMKQTGHLWQSRFYSCVLDESHLLAAARYIERNPVRAHLVEKPWQWKWSIALTHISDNKSYLLLDDFFEFVEVPSKCWKDFIDLPEKEGVMTAIRKHTLTGLPLGSSSFVGKLEENFGRKLSVPPRGRPW